MKADSTLLPFYFGSVDDDERMKIEQELLIDPSMLLDYLDLKRKLEGASAVPSVPSPALWNRLNARFKKSRRTRISLAIGLTFAAVASLVLIFLSIERPGQDKKMVETGVLFDSGHEQFGLSNVL